MLVKRDNQLLALKILEEQSIVQFDQVKHILWEKSIRQAIDSPFIVNLIYLDLGRMWTTCSEQSLRFSVASVFYFKFDQF